MQNGNAVPWVTGHIRMQYDVRTPLRQNRSAHGLDRLAVDAGLVLKIIDCYVGIVPGEARARAEA